MFNKYFHSKSARALTVFLTAVFFFALGGHAFAAAAVTNDAAMIDAGSLGDVFCNAFASTAGFGNVFLYSAYVAGVACALQALHHFRLHADNPTNNHIRTPLMFLFGSFCLLSLPSVIDVFASSLYGAGGNDGDVICTQGAVGGGTTLDAMLVGFVGNIKGPIISLVSMTGIVCGLAMMVNGLIKAAKHGTDPRSHSVQSIMANIIFGTLLLTLGDGMETMMASLFGVPTVSASSVISWTFADSLAGGASDEFKAAITAALNFVQIIGVIAFVRGWLVLKKVVEGGGNVTMAQGLTHVIGGAMAINIFDFLKIMDATFGTNLLT